MGVNAQGEMTAEFKQTRPALVLITKNDNEYEDELGLETAKEMNDRLKVRDATYVSLWTRRKKGPQDKPHYKKIGHDHLPVIMLPGEWVRFECAHPFLAILMPEPNLDLPVGNPSSPIQGTDPNFPFSGNSTASTGCHFLEAQVRMEPNTQLFYKMLFIILDRDAKKPEIFDPDFFCDR